MLSSRAVTVIALVLLAFGFLVGVGAGAGIGAADDNESIVVDDPIELEEAPDEVFAELTEDIRVQSYSYERESGELSVVVENVGSSRDRISVVEVAEPGSDGWQMRQATIRGGETIEISLERVPDREGDPAALVASERSMDQRSVVWLPTGEPSEPEESPTWQALLLGIGLTVAATGLVAFRRYNSAGSSPVRVEEKL